MKRLLLVVACLTVLNGFGQKSYWRAISEREALLQAKGNIFSETFKPASYKLFALDEEHLQELLLKAALRSITPVDKSTLIIQVPLSDGSLRKFRIAESPVMQPQLQAKYTGIRSYIGMDINNTFSRIYFDFTVLGFHAMIISPLEKTVYINPAVSGRGVYTVFDRSNLPAEKQAFDCKLDQLLNNSVQGSAETFAQTDAKLRT